MANESRTGGRQPGSVPGDGTRNAEREIRDEARDTRRDMESTARGAKQELKSEAREMEEDVKASAREAKQEVKERARDVKDDVQERALNAAERRKGSLAESVNALASALEAAASRLDEQQERRLAGWTRDASSRVERMAGYLRENDMQGLTRDLRSTARENPAAFVGTSFAAGLAAGRFLRAGEPEPEYEETGRRYDTTGRGLEERVGTPSMGTAGSFGAGTTDASRAVEESDRIAQGNRTGLAAGSNLSAASPRTGGAAMASQSAGGANPTTGPNPSQPRRSTTGRERERSTTEGGNR